MSKFYKATAADLDITNGKIYEIFVDECGVNRFLDDVGDERALSAHIDALSYMIPAVETSSNPFIKTVTETRLCSAYHDLPNGLTLFVEPRKDEVKIDLESGMLNKQSLTELAQILSEIAEAM